MSNLQEIKEKYPLAVEALKGTHSNYIEQEREVNCISGWLTLSIHGEIDGEYSNQIGELLAELLNLIAKP